MATVYRVANGNWNDADSWADSSGGTNYVSTPTSSDDVVFDANTPNGTHTVNTAASVKSINFTGFTGTLAGIQAITVSGNITFEGAMTTTFTGTITVNADSTITTDALSLTSALTINGPGITVGLADAYTSSGNITLTQGTFDTNDFAVGCNAFLMSGASTRTLTSGTSAITCAYFHAGTTTNLTSDLSGTTINWNPVAANAYFNGGGLTYGVVNISNVIDWVYQTPYINDANTFGALTITGGDSKNNGLLIKDNQTVTGTLTIIGDDRSKETVICSDSINEQRTITAATTSLKNVCFRDVVGDGAADWTGKNVRDYGNNSGITFSEFKY